MMFADDCDLYWEQVEVSFGKRGKGNIFEKWNAEEIVNGRNSLQERHCTCCLWPGCFVTRGGHRCAPRLPVQTSLMCWQHPQRDTQCGFDAGPWRDCVGENALMMSGGQSRALHVRLSCTALTSLSGYQGGIIVALQQSPLIQWVWQWAHVGFVSARLPVAFLSSPFTRAGSCL